jgi:hypothetical protein
VREHDAKELEWRGAVQKDYVIRMIEQLAAAIAELRKRLLDGSPDGAEEVEKLASAHGVDLATARAVDGETLLLLLAPAGEPEPSRTWITAELLYLDALRLEADGDREEAAHGFAKSLLLYGMIDASMHGGLPEAGDRMAELRMRLHEQSL